MTSHRTIFRGKLVFVLLTTVGGATATGSTSELRAEPGVPFVRRFIPGEGLRKAMVLVPAGPFVMGSEAGRPDEAPVRTVTVSGFYMDETPLTYGDYEALGRWGAARTSYWLYDTYNIPDNPITGVRWHEAACACNLRSVREGLQPAYYDTGRVDSYGYPVWQVDFETSGYRLPTEAEWEKAARGGLAGRVFPWGNTFEARLANMDEGRGYRRGRWWRLAPVRSLHRNGYGLYGMSGNVWEWTNDRYAPDAYGNAARRDPLGPKSGQARVVRGGSWGSYRTEQLRVSRRSRSLPGNYNFDIGFRCVRPARTDGRPRTAGPRARAAAVRTASCRILSRALPSAVARDGFGPAFRARLAAYLADAVPESVYLNERVDGQAPLTPESWAELVTEVSLKHRVHPLFLVGIMKAESGLGVVSFPRWFNNPMAYEWGNWKMAYGPPLYFVRAYRNRRYRTLAEGFNLYAAGIRRKLYVRAARRDLYGFHRIYVGSEAHEWMRSVSTVYRDVLGVDFGSTIPPSGAGTHIYLDWERLRSAAPVKAPGGSRGYSSAKWGLRRSSTARSPSSKLPERKRSSPDSSS